MFFISVHTILAVILLHPFVILYPSSTLGLITLSYSMLQCIRTLIETTEEHSVTNSRS